MITITTTISVIMMMINTTRCDKISFLKNYTDAINCIDIDDKAAIAIQGLIRILDASHQANKSNKSSEYKSYVSLYAGFLLSDMPYDAKMVICEIINDMPSASIDKKFIVEIVSQFRLMLELSKLSPKERSERLKKLRTFTNIVSDS